MAIPILSTLDVHPKRVIADRGYDSNAIAAHIQSMHAAAVIPPRRNRKVLRNFDKVAYNTRNIIERYFARIKQFRRVATRYEKTALSFASMLQIASLYITLRDCCILQKKLLHLTEQMRRCRVWPAHRA